MEFMREFKEQGGIAFFLIYYTKKDLFYYMNVDEMSIFYERMINNGRKSIRFDELKSENFLPKKSGVLVPYLDMIARDASELS